MSSCQVRKWQAFGAAAAAAAGSRTAETPAKKEMDSRFQDLLAARAAQDEWMRSGPSAVPSAAPKCTSAERSHPSTAPFSSGKDPHVPSSQQTAARNSQCGTANPLR